MASVEDMSGAWTSISQGHYLVVLKLVETAEIIKDSLSWLHKKDGHDQEPGSPSESENALLVAIASLQLFVQYNWSGPLDTADDQLLNALSIDMQDYGKLTDQAVLALAVDGEAVYERIRHPVLLAISRHLLSCEENTASTSRDWLVWQLRSINIHQSMINERCDSLKTEALKCIQLLTNVEEECIARSYSENLGDKSFCWKLEAAAQCRFYFEHQTCKNLLAEAVEMSKLNVTMTGVTGKRTKYQERDIAQLVLTVQHQTTGGGDQSHSAAANTAQSEESKKIILPKNELLHDDTVLNQIQLNTTSSADNAKLNWAEQCLLLALCEENSYVKPAVDSDITDEETSAYLTYILSDPCDWSVQCKALLMRSLMEKNSARRIERSLRQLEELCSLTTTSEPNACERLRGIYTSRLPPSWQLQNRLGELQMDLGAYASAMEIFERLGLWDPLIVCSQRAGRLGKAEELIRARLLVQETAPLYCSLSDVTGDIQYYHKAWQLANCKSARAMRGLAFHHLRACEYDEAISCFEKTLAINPLQLPCWFSYGCSSLAAGYYDKAATAFRRCVILNEDNFEAWNNLAAAYARSDQKPRAFAVLQDALKCSYDNWKIWENYIVIGADCGEISEVIRGAHRILELTGKWQDEQVIEHITRFVIQDLKDAKNQPSSCHKEALLKLLGHATSKVTTSHVLWRCYGRVLLHEKEKYCETAERGIQCLQKAYRCSIKDVNWEKSEEQCKLSTEILLELVDAYSIAATKRHVSTAKLQLNTHISRLKKGHTDPVTKSISSSLINALLDGLNEAVVNLPDPVD